MEKRKIIAGLLALTLVVGSAGLPGTVREKSGVGIAASALNQEVVSGEYTYIILDDGTIEIRRYNGDDEVVELPNAIDGRNVTSVGSMTFFNCYTLKSLIIPDGVTNIADEVFVNCDNFKSVKIPKSVTKIGNFSFHHCNALESIEVDSANNFYSSEDGVLYDKNKETLLTCPLYREELNIPYGVKTIGRYAFSGNTIKRVIMPDSVTTTCN